MTKCHGLGIGKTIPQTIFEIWEFEGVWGMSQIFQGCLSGRLWWWWYTVLVAGLVVWYGVIWIGWWWKWWWPTKSSRTHLKRGTSAKKSPDCRVRYQSWTCYWLEVKKWRLDCSQMCWCNSWAAHQWRGIIAASLEKLQIEVGAISPNGWEIKTTNPHPRLPLIPAPDEN